MKRRTEQKRASLKLTTNKMVAIELNAKRFEKACRELDEINQNLIEANAKMIEKGW